ncbi:MAG: flagellar export protein FliJ [Phycisphaerae bacterium]|nr:flagellar export protein FliJ [Phycisphaerae bacterium]|tara:strand:+ start:186 stop:626 length:441 start_codon:yes stop_codon:yes gene_type:complete
MKRFKFQLQRILDVRMREERQAQRNLAVLNRQRSLIEQRLRSAESKRQTALEQRRSSLVGDLEIDQLRLQALMVHQQDRQARQLMLELAAMEPEREEARRILLQATTARRSLEWLRERTRARWLREQRRQERRDEQELNTIRETVT